MNIFLHVFEALMAAWLFCTLGILMVFVVEHFRDKYIEYKFLRNLKKMEKTHVNTK